MAFSDNSSSRPVDFYTQARDEVLTALSATVRENADWKYKPIVDVATMYVATGVADGLTGLVAIACLHSMFKYGFEQEGIPLDKELVTDFFLKLNAYFTFEKVSDDHGAEYNPVTGVFENGRDVKKFNELAKRVLYGEPLDIVSEVNQIKVGRIKRDLLVNNIDSLRQVRSYMVENWYYFKENFWGLERIYDFAFQSLLDRYEGSTDVIENPHVDVHTAVKDGKRTILVNAFITYALALAHASLIGSEKGHLALEINDNCQAVTGAVESMSYLVRLLNDTGKVSTDPDLAFNIINKIRDEVGMHLSPRNFMLKLRNMNRSKYLSSEDLKEVKNFFSRLMKDAYEREYNIVFNSEFSPGMPLEKMWYTFFHNLNVCNEIYFYPHLARFLDQIIILRETAPPLYDFYLRFLMANLELYGTLGDYDNRKADWRKMVAMTATSDQLYKYLRHVQDSMTSRCNLDSDFKQYLRNYRNLRNV